MGEGVGGAPNRHTPDETGGTPQAHTHKKKARAEDDTEQSSAPPTPDMPNTNIVLQMLNRCGILRLSVTAKSIAFWSHRD